MFVLKIEPCMHHYRAKYGESTNGTLNQLLFPGRNSDTWIPAAVEGTEVDGSVTMVPPKMWVCLAVFTQIHRPTHGGYGS